MLTLRQLTDKTNKDFTPLLSGVHRNYYPGDRPLDLDAAMQPSVVISCGIASFFEDTLKLNTYNASWLCQKLLPFTEKIGLRVASHCENVINGENSNYQPADVVVIADNLYVTCTGNSVYYDWRTFGELVELLRQPQSIAQFFPEIFYVRIMADTLMSAQARKLETSLERNPNASRTSDQETSG